MHDLRQAIPHMYAYVRAGRYCHHTIIPRLTKNISQIHQSTYDGSLSVEKLKFTAVALCTNYILSAIPQSLAKEEQQISSTFTSRNSQATPTYIKFIDYLQQHKKLTVPNTA